MHFPTAAAVLSALSAVCSADWLEVYQRCRALDKCEGLGYFHTDYGEYEVNANDGCHRTSKPAMTQFCIDWSQGRAHFKFAGQPSKRCMIHTRTEDWNCAFKYCRKPIFEEIGCSWYVAETQSADDGALPFTMKKPA
ncbi:hypothetical protein LLEC1_04818 [Akanthomyces lecanii]|uniref:Cyanovirin-N domain-containing protein n=1 Tax=Cordyceps confragosa TaxID=2714763 RepID=A0A179I082_CORDF|nr:hypothetical protein LLEC1_04818 [Akanthomyces lecanii]